MLTPQQLRYGKIEDLPRPIALRAGLLSLQYEDGDLRYIRCGDHELVRRIYMAVRDRNWGTILPVYSNVQMDIGHDHFNIIYEVDNQLDDIHFSWRGYLQGIPDGSVTFRMEGQAITTFLKNRIGLCVLHPASVAGKPCRITQQGGSEHRTVFPDRITADQPPLPYTDMTGLAYTVGNATVEIAFEGDTFEMEDQRNWTDASFKTFCPPLRFPYPNEITNGTKVCQTVSLCTRLEKGRTYPPQARKVSPSLQVNLQSVGRLPALGTGIASLGGLLSTLEIARLKGLRLSHLRADLWLSDPGFPDEFHRAAIQSRALSIPLYLALHISENGKKELVQFAEIYQDVQPEVALWLVYPGREMYHGGSTATQVVEWIKKTNIIKLSKQPFRVASGTDADFIFLLRNLPSFSQIDVVCFAVSPQVHAFDNSSIVETLQVQGTMVANPRDISGGLPVVVSPVTLRPRYNPYATGAIPAVPSGELPPQVDYRQPSLFAAAWLVGSLRAMALGGASAVTYFETTGWRGLMETESGSPVPGKFHSIPGTVFPVYHILADVAELKPTEDSGNVEVMAAESNADLQIQALALRSEDRLRVLVANLTPEPQVLAMSGMPGWVGVRFLDETNVEEVMRAPEAFRSQPLEIRKPRKGNLQLHLLPYAVATLDWS